MTATRTTPSAVLGIDVGGSGIKGAPVDVDTGRMLDERRLIPTPQPAVPETVAEVVAELVRYFGWSGPIGCAFPAVIKDGVAYTATNVDPSWIGTDGRRLLEEKTGCPVTLLNDADAAGIAEVELGAGRGQAGVVIMITLGTGIGSAIFTDGRLVPNSELGQLVIRGRSAEERASGRAREQHGLTWDQWARRLNEYLRYVEALLSPDLFIIGGGVSQDHDKYLHLLSTAARVVPAELLNDAGIVGSALAAKRAAAAVASR